MSAITAWCVAAALAHSPVERLVGDDRFGDATTEEAHARVASICADIVAAAEAEPAKKGYSTRSRVALLLAIGIGESGLARDADLGPCYHGGGYATRCDAVKGQDTSASVWQVKAIGDGPDDQPLTISGLFADRKLAARVALRRALSSIAMCRKEGLPEVDWLRAYGVGTCLPGAYRGQKSVRARWALFWKIKDWNPPMVKP